MIVIKNKQNVIADDTTLLASSSDPVTLQTELKIKDF